jgi:lysophospholipase L1-like esterase
MSAVHRVRARLLVCVAAIATLGALALGALAFAPAAGAASVGSTYLALGDSLAYGYHRAQFESEYPNINPANYHEGYVNDFGAVLKLANPHLQIINDGCPGETTETFIKGSQAPYTGAYCAGGPTGSPWPYVWLHHPYTTSSQLSDALNILKTTPNVSPITIDIGANDLLQFLGYTCGFPANYKCTEAQVGAEIEHIAGNVYYILTQLHGAAPHAQIVLMGIYNAYPAVLKPEGTGDKSIAAFNAAEASVAAKVPDASFANPEPLFNPSIITKKPEVSDLTTICAFTAMCPGGTFSIAGDIHPTTLGYAVLAGDVAVDWLTH